MSKRSKLINIICAMMIGVVFVLAVMLALVFSGVLSLNKNKLVITTGNAEAMYSGKALTNHTWNMEKGSLKKGHEMLVTFKGSQTSVGESENVMEVKIIDELGADVTGDYSIDFKFGKIKVNPRVLVITSESASKQYDGKPLTATEYEISPECDGVVKGQKENVIVTGYIVDPGKTNNTVLSVSVRDITGNDVTNNYHIVIREGLLVIDSDEAPSGGGSSGGGGGSSGGGGGSSGGDIQGGTIPDFSGGSNLIPPENLEGTVLLRVFSDKSGAIYLKLESFGDYTGQEFTEAQESDILIDGKLSASYLPSFIISDKFNSVKIKSYHGLYVLPSYMMLSGDYDVQTSDVRYSGDASKTYTVDYYSEYPYKNVSIPAEYKSFNNEYYKNIAKPLYLGVDAATREYMTKICEANGFKASDPDIIEKVAKYIQNAAKYNRDYDKNLDSEPNVAIAFLQSYGEGVCRHYAMAATMMFRSLGIPARYTVGVLANAEAGKWVNVTARYAHAWVEVYVNGKGWITVEVTGSSSDGPLTPGGGSGSGSGGSGGSGGGDVVLGAKIEVKQESVRQMYNGSPLNASEKVDVLGFEEYEKAGYYYKITVSGNRTQPGISKGSVIIVIYDSEGKDVTSDFADKIEIKPGNIHVYIDVIYVASAGCEKTYDGKTVPLDAELIGGNANGLTLKYTQKTQATSVGTHLNEFDVEVFDGNGAKVNDNYWIVKTYGRITVTPKAITLKAGDAQKVYDGSALTCEEIEITEGALAEGHIIKSFSVSGKQAEPGRSDNIITEIMICDENGRDVTANYSIKLVAGKLTVTLK